MALSEAQGQEVINWMRAQGASLNCLSCGQSNLVPHDIAFAPPRDEQGNPDFGVAPPMVRVICQSCAFTMLYAARPIGLI
jgi:hypothetical protein